MPNAVGVENIPTTGFSMLILLLKLGGYGSINMFGFDFYENGAKSVLRTESGLNSGVSDAHDYDLEKEFVMLYSYEIDKKNNIITFYDYSTF